MSFANNAIVRLSTWSSLPFTCARINASFPLPLRNDAAGVVQYEVTFEMSEFDSRVAVTFLPTATTAGDDTNPARADTQDDQALFATEMRSNKRLGLGRGGRSTDKSARLQLLECPNPKNGHDYEQQSRSQPELRGDIERQTYPIYSTSGLLRFNSSATYGRVQIIEERRRHLFVSEPSLRKVHEKQR